MKRYFAIAPLTLFFPILIFVESNLAQEDSNHSKWELVVSGLNFPEGPAWNGKNLFVSSIYAGSIIKVTSDSSYVFVDSIKNEPLNRPNGLAFDKNGNLFACDFGIGAIIKISPSKNVEIYCDSFGGNNSPNDLAFDTEGNLYFTDPDLINMDKPGFVYRINSKTKEVKPVAENLAFPNGIAFSKNGGNLFVSESAEKRILKYEVDEEGNLKNKSVFVDLPGYPDGIAFDIKENLYAAVFGSGQVYIISPKGNIKDSISTPGKNPSNVEFGGETLKTLFITEDETNSVYKTTVELPGLKLHYTE